MYKHTLLIYVSLVLTACHRESSLHVALHSGQGEYLHLAALTSVFQKAEQLLAGYSVGWTVKQCRGKKVKSSFEKRCTNLGTFLSQKEKVSGLVLLVMG